MHTARIALLATIGVLTAGCGSAPRPAPAPVQNEVKPSGPSLADPLALLPADSDVVMTIGVASLRESPLFAKYREVVRNFIVPGFADCKYDPFDDIDTVSIGLPMSAELGVFVVRGLDRDKTLDCLRTSKTETNTDVVFDGDLVSLNNKSGHSNLLKFVDAKNAVFQGSTGPTRETLAKALLVGAPLRENKAFVAAHQSVAPGAAFSMLSLPGAPGLAERLEAKIGAKVSQFAATVHVTDVVSGRVTVVLADASTATTFVENMRPQLEAMRQFVERYDIHADGPSVVIDLVITETQIQAFAELAKSMMGT